MVETDENSVNTTDNTTEMTTEEQVKGTTKKGSSTSDNILHSASIDNEKKSLSMSKRFIQIIGEGYSNKQNNRNEKNKARNSKEIVDNTSIIHEFDATTEDPFTLESFDTLIQQHAEKDKDFIIARVTTVDPSDELKTYHSFYSGHHINKVLFRTQPDQGLLHRMKAKNPLNNMNIIGDVHYYVIKAASVKKSTTFAKSSSMSTTSRKTLKVKGEDVTIVATSSLDKTEEKNFTSIDIQNIRLRANRLHSAPPSVWNFEYNNTKNEEEEEKVAIEMEASSTNYYNKRWSAGDSLKSPPKAFTAKHSFHDHNSSTSDGENLEKLLKSFKLQTINNNNDNNNDNNESQSSKVIHNELSISIPKNNDDINDNINSCSSLKEQQSVRITQSPTNSISTEENEGEDDSIYYKAIFYATDDDFLMRSPIRQFFKSNAFDPMDAQLFTINTSPHNNSHATTTITPPSTRLERMVTTHNGAYLIDPMVISPAQSRRNSRNAPVPTSRWRRIMYNLRNNKGLRWLVLMYMIFGFLLIRFVVSETYAYLMAFLLMLCLFLVFCVGSGVGIWGR